jgi:2-desacetyl-2-hydroxyethyl bacteriochlorophyllide A dehydrogenase
MKIFYVCADRPGDVQLKTQEYDPSTLQPDEVLLENDYSVISAGTERAWLMDMNNAHPKFPYEPGYSAAGRVIAIGGQVANLKVGDRAIVTWAGHRSHNVKKAAGLLKIEDDSIDLLDAAFAHIASFSCLGVRRLRLELGESAMVAGMGILGVFALQFAALSGAIPLFACDLDPVRRELALKLGATAAFDPSAPDFKEQVMAATGGKGVETVVEVTGVAIALKQALEYVARMGRISLLGCTRIPDVNIDFYKYVHGRGVQLIGSHTHSRPPFDSRPGEWTEHDDYRTFLKLVKAGKLQTRPLISEIVSPADAHEVYDQLVKVKNPPLGIVFDWKQIR